MNEDTHIYMMLDGKVRRLKISILSKFWAEWPWLKSPNNKSWRGWCILGWPPLFDPQGIFLQMCNVALAPRMGNIWSYDLLFKQGLALLCPCHIYYLKTFMGDKVHLFTLFLSFSSWSSNRSLVVNIYPGAHLSPASLSYFFLILSFI